MIFDGGRVIADGTIAELRHGHDEIRFRSTPGLDLRRSSPRRPAASSATRLVAREVGDGEYVVDAAPHPRLMAGLAGWLADQGAPMDDVRGGAQRLEDVFRRLTAGRTRPAAAGTEPAPRRRGRRAR